MKLKFMSVIFLMAISISNVVQAETLVSSLVWSPGQTAAVCYINSAGGTVRLEKFSVYKEDGTEIKSTATNCRENSPLAPNTGCSIIIEKLPASGAHSCKISFSGNSQGKASVRARFEKRGSGDSILVATELR